MRIEDEEEQGVTVERAIAFLNELAQVDRRALTELLETRVPCNKALAEHATVQVSGEGPPVVGLLGLLNGIFGVRSDGWGHITAIYDDAGVVQSFEDTSVSRGDG